MIPAKTKTDVVIVGGGPVGLACAIELGMRGIDCIVLEQGDGTVTVPKMNYVNTRSMEYCRHWGIATRVRSAGWPDDYPMDRVFTTGLTGYEIARVQQPSHKDRPILDFTPEGSQRCPQIWFDPLLRDYAATLPTVRLTYKTRVETLTQTPDEVRVCATDLLTAQTSEIEAQYVVGADGAGSHIRHIVGIALDKRGPSSSQVAIAVRTTNFFESHDKGRAAFYFVLDEKGVRGNITPTDGEKLWRFNISLRQDEFDETFNAESLIRHMAGEKLRFDLLSVTPWTIRFMLAQHFRDRRVFLAGDAAHTFAPTGGLGMNTGIGDAVDIGWKLAAVIHGWGGQRLLESYETERKPIAARIIAQAAENSEGLGAIPADPTIGQNSEKGRKSREIARQKILGGQVRRRWDPEDATLSNTYEHSPVIVSDGSKPPEWSPYAEYKASTYPGRRAPHVWLPDGRSILDFFGDGFTLVKSMSDAPDTSLLSRAAEAQAVPFSVITLEEPASAALYERKLVLVRPDGHVAWRGDTVPEEPEALIATVRGTLHP